MNVHFEVGFNNNEYSFYALFSYHSFDRAIQRRVMSNGMPNMTNNTFCVRTVWRSYPSQHRMIHLLLAIHLLRRNHEEHEQWLRETTAYVDSLDIQNICCSDTSSILPRPMEYSPSNCNKNDYQPV